MAAVLVMLALDYTRVGLLLLFYGVGVQLIARAVLEWTDGVPTFYWRLLLGAGIIILISSFHLIS
ncbi:hypothetical protein MHA01_13120 [Marinococcus halophilus]|uniref:Uncharacterized protein n=2 Tax=Marinococcus halophilus TaxID=1371 RepID=A0A510Y7I5_MARHA|nr:hypothetical protein MHA01_13120 [Marinococcus halophilus]